MHFARPLKPTFPLFILAKSMLGKSATYYPHHRWYHLRLELLLPSWYTVNHWETSSRGKLKTACSQRHAKLFQNYNTHEPCLKHLIQLYTWIFHYSYNPDISKILTVQSNLQKSLTWCWTDIICRLPVRNNAVSLSRHEGDFAHGTFCTRRALHKLTLFHPVAFLSFFKK